MKVLAVDDEPVAQLALSGALKALGHEVTVASSGEAAWEILAGDRSMRVVICDWWLPGLDGLELCRRLRAQREDYVSFILLTQAESSDNNLKDAFAAGVDDYLGKPIDLRRLESCLNVATRVLDFTSEIRRLQAFLPICCYCKKVRDDENYWQQIESYITTRVGTRFSHGICPACYREQVIPQLKELDLE